MKQILQIPVAIFRAIGSLFKAIFGGIKQFFVFIAHQIRLFFAALKKPFGTSIRSIKGLIYATIIGVSVAVFAMVLQPFGLADFSHVSKNLYLAGFGVVAFVAVLIAKFGLPIIASNFYDEHHWTVGKQVAQNIFIFFIISVLCVAYANALNISLNALNAIIAGITIGLVGGLILTFIQESMQKNRYVGNAENIARNLSSLKVPASKQVLPVMLFGEGNNKLSLLANQLIFAEISANSTDFYYQSLVGVEKKTISAAQAKIEQELESHPQFLRSSVNHIVNVKALHNVTGSARGYQLKLVRIEKELAVSRKYLSSFEKVVS